MGQLFQGINLGRRGIPDTFKALDMAVGKVSSLSQSFLGPTFQLPELSEMLGELGSNIGRHMGILGRHDLLDHDLQGVI